MAHMFKALGFNISKLDQSVFFRTKGNEIIHVPVSTNDMILMGNTRGAMDMLKAELHRSFEITDQGELMWLLGFEVRRDRAARLLGLNQRAYIEALAQ